MMGGTWLDSEEKTKMARYSKYLDLVPIALLQEYGVDAILSSWPLRQISKKPRLHPYVISWNDFQQKFISTPVVPIRNDGTGPVTSGGAAGTGIVTGNDGTAGSAINLTFIPSTGLPIPSTSSNVPNLAFSLVNSNNNSVNNASNNNLRAYRNRGILNECNYANSFKRNDTLGDKGRIVLGSTLAGAVVRADGTRVNNLHPLNSRTNVPNSSYVCQSLPVLYNDGGRYAHNGRFINNACSTIYYPKVKVFKGQPKSFEQDEKMRREKLRKLIYNCTVELSISSPLACKLRERLSSLLPEVSAANSQVHEKFCTTNIRSNCSEFQFYNSHLNPQFKPSRTLRSNTSLADERTNSSSSFSSSSSKSCYVHHYSFSRKQRYNRWAQIEDKLDSCQESCSFDDKHSDIQVLQSENPDNSEIRPRLDLTNVSPTPVILSFPMIDFDELAEAAREREAIARLQAEYNSLQNPPYIISFVPDDSKKPIFNDNISDLSASLGYEIILEPMSIIPESPPASISSLPSTSSAQSSYKTKVEVKQEKCLPTKIDEASNVKPLEKLSQKTTSDQLTKEFIPLRRSLRVERSSNNNKSSSKNSIVNGTCRSSKKVESQRTQLNNKKNPSICDITLSNVTDVTTKPSLSKQLSKTEDVVIKHLLPSSESVIKPRSNIRSSKRNEEKQLISMEKTSDSLKKVDHISSQPIRQSKRTMDDEVMVIRTKDDLPRKKVDTDDIIMIKVMKTSKKPRLRK